MEANFKAEISNVNTNKRGITSISLNTTLDEISNYIRAYNFLNTTFKVTMVTSDETFEIEQMELHNINTMRQGNSRIRIVGNIAEHKELFDLFEKLVEVKFEC